MAAPPSAPARPRTHYEIYVKRQDRLELHHVTEDQDGALHTAEQLAARPGTLVRVMREVYDPERDETIERIVFDSSVARPFAPIAPGQEPSGPAQSQPALARRRDRPPARSVASLVAVFGGLGLALMIAAATAAVF